MHMNTDAPLPVTALPRGPVRSAPHKPEPAPGPSVIFLPTERKPRRPAELREQTGEDAATFKKRTIPQLFALVSAPRAQRYSVHDSVPLQLPAR